MSGRARVDSRGAGSDGFVILVRIMLKTIVKKRDRGNLWTIPTGNQQ